MQAALRWLQAHPIRLALAAWLMVEAAYAVLRWWAPVEGWAGPLGLTFAAAWLAAAFWGRPPHILRDALIGVALALLAGWLCFYALSYLVVTAILPDHYRTVYTLHGLFGPDEALGFRTRPDLNGAPMYFAERGGDMPVTTDGAGRRHLPADPAEGARVAVLGDSFVFGQNVADDEVWSAGYAARFGYPVANYGAIAYNLWQHNRLVELEFRPGRYDTVVLAIFANDLAAQDGVETRLQNLILWGWASPVSYTWSQLVPVLARSPGDHLWRAAFGEERGTFPPGEEVGGLVPDCAGSASLDYVPSRHNPILAGQLDRALTLAEGRGYRLLVIVLPSKERVYADLFAEACGGAPPAGPAREQAAAAFICGHIDARAGRCTDLTATLQAAAEASPTPLYYRLDGHWNPEGQAAFARALASLLDEVATDS